MAWSSWRPRWSEPRAAHAGQSARTWPSNSRSAGDARRAWPTRFPAAQETSSLPMKPDRMTDTNPDVIHHRPDEISRRSRLMRPVVRLVLKPLLRWIACMDESRLAGVQLHRSEEHTSELQSLMRISYAVFCLKKKKTQKNN